MGQFFKFTFASCLGVILAFALLGLVSIIAITTATADANKPASIKANSVLHLELDPVLPELTNNIEISSFELKQTDILGLHDIIYAIRYAATDRDIKGIYLDTETLATGFANTQELHQALQFFKDSGKFIVAYGRFFDQNSYHLASMADYIGVHPVGLVDLRGYGAQIPFFKDLLDKMGVKMEVFYAGKFKSATEPFRRNDMSSENKMQVRAYLGEIYQQMVADISNNRNMSKGELLQAINTFAGSEPNEALKKGLIDQVGVEADAHDKIRSLTGLDTEEKISFVSIKNYFNSRKTDTDYSIRDKVAVVYAEGNIVDGKGGNGSVGDEKYVDVLDRLSRDKNVKAVVLRVNSPGGSAMASENIWRALIRLKEAEKPLVVSMGNYAASGGYYIACPADSVFAEAGTLTGSIGVFNVFPNVSRLLNEKAGIHFDTVNTAAFSNALTPFFDLSTKENRIMQVRIDSIYSLFLQRVAQGRNKSVDAVNEIAQGRVWTGAQATEIGLVDQLGSLSDAIAAAGRMAGLTDYRTVSYPKVLDPLQQFFQDFLSESSGISIMSLFSKEYGNWQKQARAMEDILQSKGAQARLPFVLTSN